jgi:hypothetical protein
MIKIKDFSCQFEKSATLSQNGKILVSRSEDGTIGLWHNR